MAPFLSRFLPVARPTPPFLKLCVRCTYRIYPPHPPTQEGSCQRDAMIRSPAIVALRKKYGKYLPHQRSNVDQVPLPFVNDMEITYEIKGTDRVVINQQGPSLGV